MDENPSGASTDQGQPPPSEPYPPFDREGSRQGRDLYDRLRDVDVRRTPDRWLGGVAAGIAHRIGLDPLVVRAAFIVLGLILGLGVALYLLAWVLIPDSAESTHLERGLRGGSFSSILLLILATLVTVGTLPIWGFGISDSFGGTVFALIVLTGLGYVLYRAWASRTSPGMVSHYGYTGVDTTSPAMSAAPASSEGPGSHAGGGEQGPPPPSDPTRFGAGPAGRPPAGPRRGRRLSGGGAVAALAAGTLLIVVGGLTWSADSLGLGGNPLTMGWAIGLALLGALLVALGVVGRRAGFVGFLAALAALAALVTTPLPADLRWTGGGGEVEWSPTSTSEMRDYQWGVGQATLNLSQLDLSGPVGDPRTVEGEDTDLQSTDLDTVSVDLGVGEMRIIVPEDLTVTVKSDIGAGQVLIADDVPLTQSNPTVGDRGTSSSESFRSGPRDGDSYGGVRIQQTSTIGTGPTELTIDARVGFGQVFITTDERQ
ncbi:MAG: PspC domain-containing protein [Ornithinimicrobium sp.]